MSDMKGKRFVTAQDVETQVFDWGRIKWLSEPLVTNAEKFSMGIVLLEPGKGHAMHNHPGVEEILYIISGEGEQTVADERRKVGPGTLIHIPPDVLHETINTGWEQMKIIAIYAPPGPEEELRKMPECKIIPAGA
jgi:oxalate decarboxylase/phosphoglucose isomerase-like protein (cupin superfamily)